MPSVGAGRDACCPHPASQHGLGVRRRADSPGMINKSGHFKSSCNAKRPATVITRGAHPRQRRPPPTAPAAHVLHPVRLRPDCPPSFTNLAGRVANRPFRPSTDLAHSDSGSTARAVRRHERFAGRQPPDPCTNTVRYSPTSHWSAVVAVKASAPDAPVLDCQATVQLVVARHRPFSASAGAFLQRAPRELVPARRLRPPVKLGGRRDTRTLACQGRRRARHVDVSCGRLAQRPGCRCQGRRGSHGHIAGRHRHGHRRRVVDP